MKKHVENHIGTILILIVLTLIGHITSSGGIWLTNVYPEQSEFIGIGLIAGFTTYLLYRLIYTLVDISHGHGEISNHKN